MRRHFAIFLAVAAWAAGAEAAVCSASSGASVRPLLELYTSEGCSSCPPADRWMSAFSAGSARHDAVPLAFHVDYWDALGWKDRFADARFTARQRRRVNAAGERVVYTPQVMLGESVRTDWRNPKALQARLTALQAQPAPAALALHVSTDAAGARVELGAVLAGASPDRSAQAWLALYADGLETPVQAGENRGARLRHDRVVLQLHGPWPLKADGRLSTRAALDWPPERGAELGLVAFVEDAVTGSPLQALDVRFADCVDGT